MTASRALWAGLGLLLAITAVNLLGGRERPAVPPPVPVDSSRVTVLHDTVRVLDSASRRSLDSLRHAFKRRPVRDVIAYLPGHVESVAVVESVLVPEPVVRASADSLAQCWHDRDSVTRSVTLWQAREATQREALRLCEARPVPVQPDPPSRLAWASAGAGAAILSVLSIVILSR